MKFREKIFLAAAVLAIIFWLIYLTKSIMAPFICSLVVAYFLDPLVDLLQTKFKMSRTISTSLIVGLFFAIFVSVCIILVPIIYSQLSSLIEALPNYLNILTNDFYPKIANLLNKIGFKLDNDFAHLIESERTSSSMLDFSGDILNNAIHSSITIINILSLIFVTPILIFYLLKDWDVLVDRINNYLPSSASHQIKTVAREIDKTLSGYVRGQFNVCLILAIIYATLLSITGLNFGFLIGLLTGLFSFIPYVGALSGITVAIILALFQWGFSAPDIVAVSLVFIFGQLIESNFLTPRLIGKRVGLHPVWIVFGLFFFGTLFGFIGILVAVPLSAICGVIIKHFALEYKKRYT